MSEPLAITHRLHYMTIRRDPRLARNSSYESLSTIDPCRSDLLPSPVSAVQLKGIILVA